MRQITVYMSDGDTITTDINGTDDEIIRHYLGRKFEAGSDTKHHVALCVHFHDTDKRFGLLVQNIESSSIRRITGVREEAGQCIWLKVADTEYALGDVWVYDLNGSWIRGIGYKHPTA